MSQVCIDGVQVEPLVLGLLQGLSGEGPKTVEQLGDDGNLAGTPREPHGNPTGTRREPSRNHKSHKTTKEIIYKSLGTLENDDFFSSN